MQGLLHHMLPHDIIGYIAIYHTSSTSSCSWCHGIYKTLETIYGSDSKKSELLVETIDNVDRETRDDMTLAIYKFWQCSLDIIVNK